MLALLLGCAPATESEVDATLADAPPDALPDAAVCPEPADCALEICRDTPACTDCGGCSPAYPPGPYGIGPGRTLANLHLVDCEGAPVELEDYLGRARAFWITIQAGWCASCRTQRPVLRQVHEALSGEGLVVLMILGEDASPGSGVVGNETCRAFTERYDYEFPVLQDEGFAQTGYLTRSALPRQLVLDAELRIHAYEQGWEAWMEPRYRALLHELLGLPE